MCGPGTRWMEVTQRILQERCGLTLRFHSTPELLCPDTDESGSISNAYSTVVIHLGATRLIGQGEGSRIVVRMVSLTRLFLSMQS